LISLGANPKERTPDGVNAIMLAVFSRRIEPVRFLLDLGIDVNETRTGDGGALHLAIRFGLNNVIELLVARGAKLTTKDRFGRDALAEAEFEAPKSTIELLRNLTARPPN
ncbi:MAG: ankyrin repeat domain-containing protein, partial [Acidobacteriota bacterium]